MGKSGKNNNIPWPFIILWGLVVIVGIQGYFLLTKRPEIKPPVPPVVKPVPRPTPLRQATGRITIVLDDWGFNKTHCKNLKAFDAPVAAAILPNLQYSDDILQCAISSGQEAVLHLPLEPHVNKDPYPQGYLLTTEMSQREVLKLLKRMLDKYPGIVGVNNHMGSKATEDKELMTTILTELKRRKLFFVDSVTSGHSICPEVAKAVGIPFARRVVFLDNRNERVAIEKEFAEAAKIARNKGFALVIGHDRALTLQIVDEQIHKLKQQGYEFISVKNFIKAQSQ